MLDRLRRKLGFANVISVLALFVALGGGAYAVNIAKNSVGSKQIKDGAVKTKKIAKDAVTSAQVKNGSLLGDDFGAGQLPAGPQGPKGDQGVAGSALAFAHVNTDKTIDSPNSKNIASLTPVFTPGVYCLDVTAGQAPRNVVVTLDLAAGAATDQGWATLNPATVAFNCAGLPNADLLVGTTNSAGAGINRAFYISVN